MQTRAVDGMKGSHFASGTEKRKHFRPKGSEGVAAAVPSAIWVHRVPDGSANKTPLNWSTSGVSSHSRLHAASSSASVVGEPTS